MFSCRSCRSYLADGLELVVAGARPLERCMFSSWSCRSHLLAGGLSGDIHALVFVWQRHMLVSCLELNDNSSLLLSSSYDGVSGFTVERLELQHRRSRTFFLSSSPKPHRLKHRSMERGGGAIPFAGSTIVAPAVASSPVDGSQQGDREKAVNAEIERVNKLPANSSYAIHRLKVLNKLCHLMSIKRTTTQDEELELLFASLSI